MQKTKFKGKLFSVYINGEVTNKYGEYIGWVDEQLLSNIVNGCYNGVALDCLIRNNIKNPMLLNSKLKQFITFVKRKIITKRGKYESVARIKKAMNKNDELTASEKLVLEMSAKGYKAKQIAEHIGIKTKTVYVLRWKAKKKLN